MALFRRPAAWGEGIFMSKTNSEASASQWKHLKGESFGEGVRMLVIYHFHLNGWFWGNRVLLQESCVQLKVTILHPNGGLSSYWRNQRYCSVYCVHSLRKNQDPAPRLHCCFLTDPPFLSIPFLPWFSQFSCSVVSDSLQSHGLQHNRPPCPSTPRVYLNLCPLSRWCHSAISSSVVPFSSCLSIFPSTRVFSNESVLIC